MAQNNGHFTEQTRSIIKYGKKIKIFPVMIWNKRRKPADTTFIPYKYQLDKSCHRNK
jgi:hypothetical protein